MSKHTMNVNVLGVSWEVEYDYFPGSRGSSEYPGGPPIEPDDPGEIDLCQVTTSEGVEDLLADYVLERIKETIEERQGERMAEEAVEYADYLYDSMREERSLKD